MEKPEARSSSPGSHKKLWWAVGIVTGILAVLAGVLVFKWPYTRTAMIQRLERASSAKVEIGRFHSTYFPLPGCVAENVVFHKAAESATQEQPLLTIRTLRIQSTFPGLFSKPKRIREITAEGARIHLSPEAAGPGGGTAPGAGGGSEQKQRDDMLIEELRVENAVLEVASAGGQRPLTFQIHRAVFRNLGRKNTVPFEVAVRMPLPPGEVNAGGWIGPVQEKNFRGTPISGFYGLQRADLGVFRALRGQLSSRGEFSGTLERLSVSGSTESPDFEVRASQHRLRLNTQFRGVLDLKSGDLVLPTLKAKLGNTNLDAHARIYGHPKTVELNVAQGKGEIQDLILLFSKAPQSPVTGPVTFHAVAVLPYEHRPFKQRVRLTGDFNIDPAHFSSPNTQEHVDQLSERARGEKDKKKDHDADDDSSGFERVITGLHGHVTLKNGTATFSEISFHVPGAEADMNGTYNLLDKQVSLHGKMRMQATVSQATTGAKSVFLKVLDPLFKKKGAGSEVSVAMTGTYGHTRFKAGLK
jgi:hypothetical protein